MFYSVGVIEHDADNSTLLADDQGPLYLQARLSNELAPCLVNQAIPLLQYATFTTGSFHALCHPPLPSGSGRLSSDL